MSHLLELIPWTNRDAEVMVTSFYKGHQFQDDIYQRGLAPHKVLPHYYESSSIFDSMEKYAEINVRYCMRSIGDMTSIQVMTYIVL